MYWRLADCGVPVEHLVYARVSHSDFVTAWRKRIGSADRTPTTQPVVCSSANGAPTLAPCVGKAGVGKPAALGPEAVLGSASAAPGPAAALGSVAALGSPAACGSASVQGAAGAFACGCHGSEDVWQPSASEPSVSTQGCGVGGLHEERGLGVADLPGFAQDLVAILAKPVQVAQRPCSST